MIEEIIRNYLLSVLDVPVYIDVPAEPPVSYVAIERTGGGMDEHIRRADVVISSYGASRYGAAVLHEQVLAAMPNIATGAVISACDINSEYDNTDLETKRYRYEAYYNIIYY